MPNLHVTDRQVMLYMTRSQQHDQESAAAMAGFSARTARRIDKDPRLPSQKRQPRTWRTRTDPRSCDATLEGSADAVWKNFRAARTRRFTSPNQPRCDPARPQVHGQNPPANSNERGRALMSRPKVPP